MVIVGIIMPSSVMVRAELYLELVSMDDYDDSIKWCFVSKDLLINHGWHELAAIKLIYNCLGLLE